MKANRLVALVVVAFFIALSTVNAADPPVIENLHIGAVLPGLIVNQTLWTSQGDPPIIWGNFTFDSFIPLYGNPPGGPFHAATFDTETQLFSWDSTGSPHGVYEWR